MSWLLVFPIILIKINFYLVFVLKKGRENRGRRREGERRKKERDCSERKERG
jgi:hypothetical protein